jgi:hypothetical protein
MQNLGWCFLQTISLNERPARLSILEMVTGVTLNIPAIDCTVASGLFNLASITLSLVALIRRLPAHLRHRVETRDISTPQSTQVFGWKYLRGRPII